MPVDVSGRGFEFVSADFRRPHTIEAATTKINCSEASKERSIRGTAGNGDGVLLRPATTYVQLQRVQRASSVDDDVQLHPRVYTSQGLALFILGTSRVNVFRVLEQLVKQIKKSDI